MHAISVAKTNCFVNACDNSAAGQATKDSVRASTVNETVRSIGFKNTNLIIVRIHTFKHLPPLTIIYYGSRNWPHKYFCEMKKGGWGAWKV